jgi:hypothetical protein
LAGAILSVAASMAHAQPSLSPVARSAAGWSAGIGLEEAYFSQVQLSDTVGMSTVTSRVRADVARFWRTDRNSLSLAAGGGMLRFHQTDPVDQVAYDLTASASRRLSRRASSNAGFQLRKDVTSRTGGFGDSLGIALRGLTTVQGGSGSFSLDYMISRRLNSSLSANTERATFGGATGGISNRASGASVLLSAVATRHSSYGVSASFRRTAVDTLSYDLPEVSAQARYQLNERTSMGLVAGGVFASGNGQPSATYLNGRADLTFADSRGNAFSVDLSRTTGQLFGLAATGLLTTNTAGVGYRRTLSRKMSADLRTAYGKSNAVTADSDPIESVDASFGARYLLLPNATISVSAFGARRTSGATFVNSGVTAGFNYIWSRGAAR